MIDNEPQANLKVYLKEHPPSLIKKEIKTNHPNFQGYNWKNIFFRRKGHLNHSPGLEFLFDYTASTTLAGMGWGRGDPLILVQLWAKDFSLIPHSTGETKLGH